MFTRVVSRSFSTGPKGHKVVIVGGGCAGTALGACLTAKLGSDVAIVEPSVTHYYQPGLTLVGAGIFGLPHFTKTMKEVLPPKATHYNTAAKEFDPVQNTVTLNDGTKLQYDVLVIATGIVPKWSHIKGFKEALATKGVCTIYLPQEATRTYDEIQACDGGNALFTFPAAPIKCPGAPQKIMFMAEDFWSNKGTINKFNIKYMTGIGKQFAVEKYAKQLIKICDERNIERNYFHDLREIRPKSKEAVFMVTDGPKKGEEVVMKYDFLHVGPAYETPECIKNSTLVNEAGFVNVDKNTMQHVTYPNVFSLGDASSIPTSKTSAAVASQVKALKENVVACLKGDKKMPEQYLGYCTCPLLVGRQKLIMAEFNGFDFSLQETFPFDQSIPRHSMYLVKKYTLDPIYWHMMMKGMWFGPKPFRDAFKKVLPAMYEGR